MYQPQTKKRKERESKRLYCKKCKKGLGYPTPSRIKRYGSEKKLAENYLCMKCRRWEPYGVYLKKIRAEVPNVLVNEDTKQVEGTTLDK